MGIAAHRAGVRQKPTSSAGTRLAVMIGGAYYVSPNGSDAADGRTASTPFATIEAALGSVGAGGTVLLQRGGLWTDLAEPTITTPGVLLDAYGSGNLPIIDRGTEPTGSIFNDGFESETSAFTTNWGGKTESSSTVTLETTNPVRGTKSLKYTHASSGTAYASKTLTAIGDVYVQLKVKLQTLVAGSAWGTGCALNLKSGGSNPLILWIGHDDVPSRGVQVRFAGAFGDITAPTYYQEGQTLRIEVRYNKTTGVSCWVNGSSIGVSDVGAHGINVDSIRVGNVLNGGTGLGAGTVLLFDDVKVNATAIGVGTRGDNGVRIDTADDVTVQNIEVCNTAQQPVLLRDCSRAAIRNNKLHDSTRQGIIAGIGGGDHIIEGNEIWFTGSEVAAFGEGSGVQFLDTTTGVNVVRSNDIHHCGNKTGDHGIYSEGGANLITLNRFYGTTGWGVKCLEGSSGSTVSRNRMEFCPPGAVVIDGATAPASPVSVYHNSAYMCGTASPFAAFWVTGHGAARLVNNISAGSNIGIDVETSDANLVASDTNAILYEWQWGYWKGANESALADWRTATGFDGSSIESDPLYTNPDAGDLTLQSGSPAKNIGTVIAGINDGFLGAAPDLGYIEVG